MRATHLISLAEAAFMAGATGQEINRVLADGGMTIVDCGFNRSMQRIDGIVQLAYRSLGSCVDVH